MIKPAKAPTSNMTAVPIVDIVKAINAGLLVCKMTQQIPIKTTSAPNDSIIQLLANSAAKSRQPGTRLILSETLKEANKNPQAKGGIAAAKRTDATVKGVSSCCTLSIAAKNTM